MILSNIAPASPPCAGRCEIQMSGLSCARMSAKSPLLLTLSGANSAMSTSPAQSSRCLISSHDRSPPPRPPIALRAHEHPRAFELVAVQRELQVALLQRRVHVVDFGRPRPAIPEHHDAGAVAGRNHAFERRRTRSDDLRPSSPAAWFSDPATVLSAPPTRAARRCVRGGSRSADDWRGASGRRRSAAADALVLRARSVASFVSPAGSGVCVKLRFCLYFSSTIGQLLRSGQARHRPCEREEQDDACGDAERGDDAEELGQRHRLVEAGQPARRCSCRRRSPRNQTPIIRPPMRTGASLVIALRPTGLGQLAECVEQVGHRSATSG